MAKALSFIPVTGIPEIPLGCDLPEMLIGHLKQAGIEQGDILVITHKIVSKASGWVMELSEVTPSEDAVEIAKTCDKDPRVVEVILQQSEKLWNCQRGILMSYRKDGWTCCNAGVDASNAGGKERVILLPENCDEQAKTISLRLSERLGYELPVLICDTHGRVLRQGAAGVAVGCWGIEAMHSYIGEYDRNGRMLMSSQEAVADELAGAATLVMGQGNESIPVVLVRGYSGRLAPENSEKLKRRPEEQVYQIQGVQMYGCDR